MKLSVAVSSKLRNAIGIVTILSCAGGALAQPNGVVQGPCASAFGAKICTSYRVVSGKVTAVSMRVPIAAIEQAPPTAPMAGPPKADVAVPFAATVQEKTGFTFSNIYWESEGHPPAAFMVPHFDFHFYFVPEAQVQAINCKDTRKPRIVPAGYSLPDITIPHMGEMIGSCVPAMGMHAVPGVDLQSKTHWEGSLIVGYYAQKPIFFEPMITRELLLRKHSFSLPIPKIAPTPNVRYPKAFRAIYHPKIEAYDLTLLY